MNNKMNYVVQCVENMRGGLVKLELALIDDDINIRRVALDAITILLENARDTVLERAWLEKDPELKEKFCLLAEKLDQ